LDLRSLFSSKELKTKNKFMKLIKIFSIVTLLFSSSCSYFQHQKYDKKSDIVLEEKPQISEKEYILGTDDIPLFSNLNLMEEDSSSFDTMDGTITISKYSSESKIELIKYFYLQALPQLGWKLDKNTSNLTSFKRENDKLEIRFSRSNKNIYVRFFISSIL
jgi:hypothetical protein